MQENRTNPNQGEKSCSICNQRFKTDTELQEHQRTAHAQQKGNQPGPERIGDKGQDRERVA
jgi:hypothetical protein